MFRGRQAKARRPVMVSAGCHVDGAALPHPDLDDPVTTAAGVCKRFASQPPPADPVWLEELRSFVRSWCSTNLVPLDPHTDLSLETWLEGTAYPAWRKEELKQQWEEHGGVLEERHLECDSFVKDECYTFADKYGPQGLEYKHCRAINARHDMFKCFSGPFFKAVESQVYKHPAFIKHVPVSQRPAYIRNMLYRAGSKYFATDFTSFEALFRRALMEVCEVELYRYMGQHLAPSLIEKIVSTLLGTNKCKFKSMRVLLEATRMSGEMCTSLGNGFSNLMFVLFVCSKVGAEALGVVEGDDGLFRVEGTVPTPQDFARLGLVIKLEVHSELSWASFCGIVADLESLQNVRDPAPVLARFAWLSAKYAKCRRSKLMSLLRVKALSLAYQFPGCPVISSLAKAALSWTRSLDVRWLLEKRGHLGLWAREALAEMLANPGVIVDPEMSSRLLVERLFGVPLETQFSLESWFDSCQVPTPIPGWLMTGLLRQNWIDYYDRYVGHYPTSRTTHFRFPPQVTLKGAEVPGEDSSLAAYTARP